MLVPPRSFKYAASPPREMAVDERLGKRSVASGARRTSSYNEQRSSATTTSTKATITTSATSTRPDLPVRVASEPVTIPSRSVAVSIMPDRTRSAGVHTMSSRFRVSSQAGRRKQTMSEKHRSDALPPAVAALLAMTAIPPPRSHQVRRRRASSGCNMSIDELVNEWKSDESLGSYGTSPSLSVLLEDLEDVDVHIAVSKESVDGRGYLHTRSTSSESIPSLEADERSLVSVGSPSTPGSLHSRRSLQNLKKEKSRSLPAGEDCACNHPLIPVDVSLDEDDGLILQSLSRSSTPKPKSFFTSNLTISLQTLKKKALSSISSLASASNTPPQVRGNFSPFADDMLWSNPYLFPRLSTEVRPEIQGTPTKAQRRYLNPMPLTFEEQEAPFQQALHAPYLAEQRSDAPTIQMQTYNRSGRSRKSGNSKQRGASGSTDPNSEAGRALLSAGGGFRQREPRENSDFLRVVVLEMNMRREGKLEMGRAKIWLPPRQFVERNVQQSGKGGKVPRRWVGEVA